MSPSISWPHTRRPSLLIVCIVFCWCVLIREAEMLNSRCKVFRGQKRLCVLRSFRASLAMYQEFTPRSSCTVSLEIWKRGSSRCTCAWQSHPPFCLPSRTLEEVELVHPALYPVCAVCKCVLIGNPSSESKQAKWYSLKAYFLDLKSLVSGKRIKIPWSGLDFSFWLWSYG